MVWLFHHFVEIHSFSPAWCSTQLSFSWFPKYAQAFPFSRSFSTEIVEHFSSRARSVSNCLFLSLSSICLRPWYVSHLLLFLPTLCAISFNIHIHFVLYVPNRSKERKFKEDLCGLMCWIKERGEKKKTRWHEKSNTKKNVQKKMNRTTRAKWSVWRRNRRRINKEKEAMRKWELNKFEIRAHVKNRRERRYDEMVAWCNCSLSQG
jgi:hypothetical protein